MNESTVSVEFELPEDLYKRLQAAIEACPRIDQPKLMRSAVVIAIDLLEGNEERVAA